jgi:hypothetical protein
VNAEKIREACDGLAERVCELEMQCTQLAQSFALLQQEPAFWRRKDDVSKLPPILMQLRAAALQVKLLRCVLARAALGPVYLRAIAAPLRDESELYHVHVCQALKEMASFVADPPADPHPKPAGVNADRVALGLGESSHPKTADNDSNYKI